VEYKHIHLLTPHSQLVTALHSSSPVTPSITYYYITTPFSISYFLVNNHQSHRNEYRTAKTLNIPSHNYRSIYPQPSLTTSIQKQQQQELRPAPPQDDTRTSLSTTTISPATGLHYQKPVSGYLLYPTTTGDAARHSRSRRLSARRRRGEGMIGI
jgi:hypothetical protein